MTYTIRSAREIFPGLVTFTVVDDRLDVFHVTIPRRETGADRVVAIIERVGDGRYSLAKPLRG